jgi:hypothetical protein
MSALKTSPVAAASLALVIGSTSPGQAAPLPTNVDMIKSALISNVAQVQWGGWRGGWHGGWGGVRPWGWGLGAATAGVIVGGAIASSAYPYGGYAYYDTYAYDGCGPYGGCYPAYGYGTVYYPAPVYGGYGYPYRQYYYGW